MRLAGFNINGFGIFHNVKLGDLSPGLTVFVGENESGKSTLLGFLRAILFGFPDGRSNENPYPPLAGGRHGGNITVVTDSEDVCVVERYAGPRGGKMNVHKPDHAQDGTAFLGRLLGKANKALFKNIYGFSLTELQNFESLNTESVREALFSAGAGIDPSNLVKLKSDLEKTEGELFKPGGTKPKINALVSRLQAIQKEKRELSGGVEAYDQLRHGIAEHTAEIRRLEDARADLSSALRKQEQWLQIWPDWINLSLAQEKLASLEVIEHFPEDGLSRYENLKTRLEDARKTLQEKKENLGRQEAAFSAERMIPDLLHQANLIRQLQRNQGHFDAVTEEIVPLREEFMNSEEKLRQNLSRLGSQWDEDRVLSFDLSIATRDEIRRLRADAKEAELEWQRRRSALDYAESEKKEAENSFRNLGEPPVKDPEVLNQMRKACQGLKNLISRVRLLENDLNYSQERLNDLEQDEAALEEVLKPGPLAFPLWLVPVIVAAGLLFLTWAGLHESWYQGAVVAGLSSLVALSLWLVRTRLRKDDQERRQAGAERFHRLVARVQELEDEKRETENELKQVQEDMTVATGLLSLSEMPNLEILEHTEEKLAGQMDRLIRWRKANEDLEESTRRRDEASQAMGRAGEALEEIERRWGAWLKKRALDGSLTPDGALETLSLIESCRDQAHRMNRLRSKLATLEDMKRSYISLVNKVLAACGRREVTEEEIHAAVQNLIQDFYKTEKAAQTRDLLHNEMKVSRESVERIQEQITGLEGEIRSLMRSAGTEDESEFRRRGHVHEAREGLKLDIAHYEDGIKRLAGTPGDIQKVLEPLSEMSPEELEAKKIALDRDLENTETTLDRFKREQAALEEQARQLMQDERISGLRIEEEGLKEQLASLAQAWCEIKLAQTLIRMGSERYEREMQPQVVSEAGRFFERLTSGAYRSLVAPMGEHRIEVVGKDESRKQIDQLSRGTAEQLYLSLRFGFIQEYGKRSESLPIIMDEILVNFDSSRARAAAKTILEFTRKHQVLFFTCHPETVHLFTEADPEVPVFRIAGGKVKRVDWRL